MTLFCSNRQRNKGNSVSWLRTAVGVRNYSLLFGLAFSRASSFLTIPTLRSAMTLTAFAGVTVSSPANGATVQSPVTFIASATATGFSRITGMAIYVDSVEVYSTRSASLDTSVSMSSGEHSIVVQATTSAR